MLVALDVNLSIDRTPAAGLPWRGLIVFGARCMADSGVLGKILAASPGDSEFGAISYICNGNKPPGVVAAVAAREQLKPETSSGVLLFNISIDDLGGVYLLVLIIQQKDLFIDLFSIGRS